MTSSGTPSGRSGRAGSPAGRRRCRSGLPAAVSTTARTSSRAGVPQELDHPVALVGGDGVGGLGPVEREPQHAALLPGEELVVEGPLGGHGRTRSQSPDGASDMVRVGCAGPWRRCPPSTSSTSACCSSAWWSGLVFAFHGYAKFFRGGRLAGTAGWFDSMGMRPGHLHARLAAAGELATGTCIASGC